MEPCETAVMKEESQSDDPKKKKRPYSQPTMTKLTPERAKQFLAHGSNCSNQEVTDLLESLRREGYRKAS
jgi:hypothetical protein